MQTVEECLASAEEAAQAGNEQQAYETLVKAGRAARYEHDGSNWALGDVASAVEVIWGQERLQTWAGEVGISYPKARMVRRVARAWEDGTRRALAEKYPHLTWSHFAVATGHSDAAGAPDAEKWMSEAGCNGWTIEEFRDQLRTAPRGPVVDFWELVGLEEFLGEALQGDRFVAAGHAVGDGFIAAVKERLECAHAKRGARSVVDPTRDVISEIREEALDVAAWAWIEHMQARYHEREPDDGFIARLMRAGFAVWAETQTAARDETQN